MKRHMSLIMSIFLVIRGNSEGGGEFGNLLAISQKALT